MNELLDKLAARFFLWRHNRCFGTCEVSDYEEFGPDHPQTLNGQGRCSQCAASEVREWITEMYDLDK